MRNTLTDRLITKIKRHASFATLFRMADADNPLPRVSGDRIPLSSAFSREGRPIVRASLASRKLGNFPGMDYQEEVQGLLPTPKSPLSAIQGPPSGISSEKTVISSQPITSPSVQKQEDRDWRRLQAIMRKHSELPAAEANSSRFDSNIIPQDDTQKETAQANNPSSTLTNQVASGITLEQEELTKKKPTQTLEQPLDNSFTPGTQRISTPEAQSIERAAIDRLGSNPQVNETGTINELMAQTPSPAQIPQTPPHALKIQESPLNTIENSQSFVSQNDRPEPTGDHLAALQPVPSTPPLATRGNVVERVQAEPEGMKQGQGARMKNDQPQQQAEIPGISGDASSLTLGNPVLGEPNFQNQGSAGKTQAVPPSIPTLRQDRTASTRNTQSIAFDPEKPESKIPTQDTLDQQKRSSIPVITSGSSELENVNLPLQSVWPVSIQQKQPEQVSSWRDLSAEPQTAINEPVKEAVIQRVLSNVDSGSPSDSQVELIVPRRPRPSALILQSEDTKRQPDQPAKKIEHAVIQTSSEGKTEDKNGTEKEEKLSPPRPIQTGIGPLPSDLWELIGKSAPVSQAESSPAGEPDLKGNSGNLTQFEMVASPTSRGAPFSQEHSSIQRQEATPAGTPEPISSPSAGPEPRDNITSNELSSQEKTELSQRVYYEIKRRLSVEWERLRHKR